jgi:Ca-activated chloride channel homolog
MRSTRALKSLAPFVATLCVLAAAIALFAQDQQGPSIRVGVNLVLLDATVKTNTGQIMNGLKKEDFEVREDGAQQKIDVFGVDQLPLQVALVLDLSDSIGPFLGPLRDAAQTTLSALKPEDQVALFTFATEAQMVMPFTKDKSAVAATIGKFKAGGATNINDGIFDAAEYFLGLPSGGRRVIVLISDDVGTSAGGQGTPDILTEITAANATLYNLKIPGDNPIGVRIHSMNTPGLVDIRKVMAQTGGELFDVDNAQNLAASFSALFARIRTRYTLGYYTDATGVMGKPHKLDVRLAPSFGVKGKNYIVLSRTSFFVP